MVNMNLISRGATVTASFFSFSGTGANGWQLLDSTVVTALGNAEFVVASGTTGITVDASTVNTQPSQTYTDINFASTSGSATNVTASGTPASYWLFSSGVGDLYGEAFDNDDGDPGAIQWDDSNFSITISGVVYQNDGVTPMGAPVCNGSTEVVTVVLDGLTTYSAACDAFTGVYEVTDVTFTGEPKITAYLESSAAVSTTTVQIYAQATTTGTTASTQAVVNRPTSIVDDTVLVAVIGRDDDAGGVATAPAGWVTIDTAETAADDHEVGMWYKIVTDAGSEPASYNFTINDNGEGYNAWVGALINVDLTNVLDVTSVWTLYLNQPSAEATDITTVTPGALALAAWYATGEDDVTPPRNGWRTQIEDYAHSENDVLTVSTKQILTPGSIGDTYLYGLDSAADTHAIQVAFRPSSTPAISGIATGAVVSQTPIGAASPYETIELRNQFSEAGTVAGSSDVAVTMPIIENGDFVVVAIGRDDNFNFTTPAGWTLADEFVTTSGADQYLGVWYRQITNAGSEPASYNFTSNDTTDEPYVYWTASFSGVDEVNPFDVTPVIGRVENNPTPPAASVTTVTPGVWVNAIWFIDNDGAVTLPGGAWETLLQDFDSAGWNMNVAAQTFAVAGTTGDVNLGGMDGVDDLLSIQLALRPQIISVPDTIRDFDFYQDRVIVRHEDVTPLTIADMAIYDNDDDADIPFTAVDAGSDLLTILPGSGLMVWDGKTFVPGGAIDLQGTGSSGVDGSVLIGATSTLTMTDMDALTIGGSFFGRTAAVFNSASSTATFTATTTDQLIGSAASSTFTFYDLAFTGVGGGWAIQTPIISLTDIVVATGTVSGVADITVETGSFSGNGSVDLTSGTTLIKRNNTLGGVNPWSFFNLTLGDALNSEVTTPASAATTTVRGQLIIDTAHFVDADTTVWDLSGSGVVFVENGTFLEGTSTVRYSGATPNILRTAYDNLIIDADASAVDALAPITGLQVLGNLTVGALSTSTLNLNTNDPLVAVGGNVFIGASGTIAASDSNTFEAYGDWDNDGVFTANDGLVELKSAGGGAIIAAGNSSFAELTVDGGGNFIFIESATATSDMLLAAGGFTLNSGVGLAVGGTFTNSMDGTLTTWTGSELFLYGGTAYDVNTKSLADDYETLTIASSTQPRMWNSVATTTNVAVGSSLYSRDHAGVDGSLYIFGDYVNNSFNDFWNYAADFDGAPLTSTTTQRQVVVEVENDGSILYQGGSLSVIGSSTASTTIDAQGGGTYDWTIGGSASTSLRYYTVRDTTSAGLTFSGSASVGDVSYGDFEIAIPGGSGMTVGGTVISANPAQNYTNNRFATTTAIAAFNVTATGTALSSWRFVNVDGNLAGEDFDNDPGGDPGLVVWEDSAAIINISGNVFENDGSMVSSVCDGSTANISLSMDGLSFASTSCAVGTGAYSFVGISYGLSDVVTVYINTDGGDRGVTVSQDPISSIGDMDIYEDHVIARHESGSPLTIADMATWDSSDDSDIPFTALTGATDTVTLPADTKLLVWTNKTFAPDGNVTVSGGGGGTAIDGTLELLSGAAFTAAGTESHSIGGSFISDAGANFTAAQSNMTFTTTAVGRTISTNADPFYDLTFTGSGDWTISDTTLQVENDLILTSGSVVLPAATTTIGGSFTTTAGSFDSNGGLLDFTAVTPGEIISFAGSNVNDVLFSGSGAWTMSDTNATATNRFTVATGSVTLPSGVLAVGEDFIIADTIAHNSGTVLLATTSSARTVTLNGNDLNNLTIRTANYTLTDASAALLGDLRVESGSLTIGNGTLAIAGSLDATGGVFDTASSSILFNSTDTGETVDPGSNEFYNVSFANATGGWTLNSNATATNNFVITSATNFTLGSGNRLYVGGVFQNTVGGAATTWTGSTLVLDSGTEYEINSKSIATELYENLVLGGDTDISSWNTSAVAVTVPVSSSLYSQDHAGVDGNLNIYGDYQIGTTTEYWSYATDFDGIALGGSSRAVTVSIAADATTTVSGTGVLNIVGDSTATSSITNQGAGQYAAIVDGGTFNASYYSFRNLDSDGLQLLGGATVPSLSFGDFQLAENGASLITLSSTTLNANASLLIDNTAFADGGFTGGANVNLDATTTNSWTFTGLIGNLAGEDYDIDGTDQCSSIRWDDSACLLTEQTHYRWRNDDGGEGAAPGTWFNDNWGARKRVRVVNNDPSVYTDPAVKLSIVYDADMQTDFEDLRFTDGSGTTTIPHWIERFTNGVSAQVWIQIPTLPADSVSEVYMYYDNVTASSTSDSANVMTVVDDFDDGNITEYSLDTGLFNVGSTFAYGGGNGLDTSGNESARADDGIVRTDQNITRGSIIRYMKYIDTTAGASDESCTLFAVQSLSAGVNQNYGICFKVLGTDRLSIVRDAENTDQFGGVTILSSTNPTFTTGWYEVEVDWQTDNSIDLALYTDAGALVATTSASDSTYTSGGYGFTYWGFNGGWDSFTTRPRTDTKPTVFIGAEQLNGGASWAAPEDTPVGGFAFGETARLRVAIDNSGLDIENQNFQLEFAPKLTAPTCEAVSGGDFTAVPVAASCGASAICMTTSASTTDGDPTTDHLLNEQGNFISGEIVANASNETSNLDVDQGQYTEIEYAINLTANAVNDAYCFRVTDSGSSLDSYAILPELTLAFDPVVSAASLNNGADIVLNPGATTTIFATGTVTDLNGFADLNNATATIYRSGAGALCSADTNDCYVATSTSGCQFTGCSGTQCTLSCEVDIFYHADATDIGTFAGEEWLAYLEVDDSAGGYDFDSAPGVELLTLRAIEVDALIDYGTLDVNTDSGATNASTDIFNYGNEAIDVDISGTDMTDGAASVIPAAEQILATTTFTYSSCTTCSNLTVLGETIELDLAKPVVASPFVNDEIYWGIAIPFGTASNPHTGANLFTAVGD